MRRFLWACLGIAALAGLLPGRGLAQSPGVSTTPKTGACPLVVEQPHPPGFRIGPSWQFDSEFDRCFRDWLLGLHSAASRESGPNLLVGVHPLMAFVSTESFADGPCKHPESSGCQSRIVPFVMWAPDSEDTPGRWVAFDCGKALCGFVGNMALPAGGSVSPHGMTCPFLIQRFVVQPPMDVNPPDVMTNLNLLIQADHLLNQGEELVRSGQLFEAVDCFQEVHRLVPGTNLEALAEAATENLLVQVYGTATENGLVDEPSESEEIQPPPPPPPCARCSSFAAARGENDAIPAAGEHAAAKAKTIVYPVADLLGRGKETRLDDLDDLVSTIATTVEPKSWANNGGEGTIEYYYRSRAVVVRQTPEVHEQIAELLAGLRQARAESETGDEKPHRTPLTGRAAKASPAKGCCEECCAAKVVRKKSPSAVAECACCDECCPITPVLTLPACPAADVVQGGGKLEIIIEGCTEEGEIAAPPPSLHWAVGGTCAEATAAADGFRFRWQMPLGPMTVLVRYEHRELTVGLGVAGKAETAAEESEDTPQTADP
jgi:hypothetical protein